MACRWSLAARSNSSSEESKVGYCVTASAATYSFGSLNISIPFSQHSPVAEQMKGILLVTWGTVEAPAIADRPRCYTRPMPEPRRFPPPWSIDESDACFIVKDHGGQKLAYFYFESEAGRRSAAKLLTRDEAFLLAVNFAKLPMVPRQILKDIPRPPNTASSDD